MHGAREKVIFSVAAAYWLIVTQLVERNVA